MRHTKRNRHHGRHHTRNNSSKGLGRGPKSRITASRKRQIKEKKRRERRAHNRYIAARATRKALSHERKRREAEQFAEQLLRRERTLREISARLDPYRRTIDPYGRYGQKMDEAAYMLADY